jgi:hypothetical protein
VTTYQELDARVSEPDRSGQKGLESVLQHISVEFAKARDEGFQKSLDRELGIEVEVVGLEPRGRRTLTQEAQPILELIQEAPEPESPRTSWTVHAPRESAQQLFRPAMRSLGFTDEIDASVNAEASEYQQGTRKWWQKRTIR